MIETYSILLIDMVCVSVSYYLSLFIRFHLIAQEAYPRDYHSMIGAYILILCLMYTLFLDGNRWFFERSNIRELYYTIRYTGIIVVGLVLILYLTQQAYEFSRLVYLIFAIINTVITFIAHIVYRRYMLDYYRKSVNSTKMFVLTREITAKDVLETLQQEKAWDYDITAAAVYDIDMVGAKIAGIPVVASMENVYDVVCQMMVDEVFLSLPGVEPAEIREMVHRFEEMGLVCHYRVDLFSKANPNTYVQQLAGYSVISFSLQSQDSRRLLVKRLMDIAGSLIGCVLTLLITPFVALAIKIDSPGPVFFSQTRIGKNGRRFKIWKFRSMCVGAEKQGTGVYSYKGDARITRVGKIIRATSIDEFPQLVNILKGNMALIGPRPALTYHPWPYEQYDEHQKHMFDVLPGVTGWAQVNGRKEVPWPERIELNVWYAQHMSLGLDLKIFFMTIFKVVTNANNENVGETGIKK